MGTPEEVEAAENATRSNATSAASLDVLPTNLSSTDALQGNTSSVPETTQVNYNTNTTEGILSMARGMMQERVKETVEKAKQDQNKIKVEAAAVNQDIDAMQKVLNNKMAMRQKLAREESDNMNRELRAKQNEEKLKFEEANDKIISAQNELARQQGIKKIEMEQSANNQKQEAERLENEKSLAIEKQKRLDSERASAAAEESENKKNIAAESLVVI